MTRVPDIEAFRAALQPRHAKPPAARPEDAWFDALPPAEQQRLQRVWDERDLRPQRWREIHRRRIRRIGRECALLLPLPLFGANLALLPFGKLLVLLAAGAGVGALVGFAIALRGAGRFGASMLGLLAYSVLQVTIGGFVVGIVEVMFLFLGAWLCTMLFALYGHRLEFRHATGESLG